MSEFPIISVTDTTTDENKKRGELCLAVDVGRLCVGAILYRYDSHTTAAYGSVPSQTEITLERYKVLSLTKKSAHLVLLNPALEGDVPTHTKKRMFYKAKVLFARTSMMQAKLDFIRRKMSYISVLAKKIQNAENAIATVKESLNDTPV